MVKLAADVEFLIAPAAATIGVGWKLALAEELKALGEGAGNVGGKPGALFARRPWEEIMQELSFQTEFKNNVVNKIRGF